MFLKDEDVQTCLFLHPEVGNEVMYPMFGLLRRIEVYHFVLGTLTHIPVPAVHSIAVAFLLPPQSSRFFHGGGNLTEVSASLGCANVKTIHVPFPGISKTTR